MQKSITFKNANISFSDEGKGTAVVLIHGFLENSTMWKDIISEISKRNRVITIDLLGHGKTECIGYSHSMELFAETVEAVLKHLRIRRSILIGHSLGGYVALAFAEKNPQKVKGLCLMNSTSNEDDEERKNLRLRANKMIQNNFTNMVRMSFSNLYGEESRIKFKEEMKSALHEALQTPIQGYIAGQEGMRIRPNRNHVLAENDFKKLIIIGKKDPVLNFDLSLAEAKKTNSEVVVFNDGHMSHIENKLELIEALKSFVKK
ncbi:alpha/beta hydrolase [Polaribacter pectinis]|uniref:Alpha/beta hydrolase n=1 Tax=Polaribacter pectinis TaxID=2738844 RepID=A0A7G9L8Z6_9FLAO|nr:alpha/beta hydrolase [Polaribacter pectinis]QNM85095.1 alpha/beta hydrolase [Polaribacter pectinis]